MTLDGKKVMEILDEYERDLFNKHVKSVMDMESNHEITVITAAQVMAVREIRDRLGIPEIKA